MTGKSALKRLSVTQVQLFDLSNDCQVASLTFVS